MTKITVNLFQDRTEKILLRQEEKNRRCLSGFYAAIF